MCPRSIGRVSRPGSDDDSSLDIYLREIARCPLIPPEEEAGIAAEIQAGNRDALDRLVRSNLRFVVSVAKQYQNRGLPLSDLINEGNLGLIRAAGKFDGTRGVKFISYAVWWIRQAMLQAIHEQMRLIRLPVNRANFLSKLNRHASDLRNELGRDPTPGELSTASGSSLTEVEEALNWAGGYLSFDLAVREGGARLQDILPDSSSPGPDAEVFELELGEYLAAALAALSPRESRVLKLYYGIDGPEALTLEEVGAIMGVTRERARQIKERALQKLRVALPPGVLESFLEP